MAGIYIHIPFCRQKCNYCDFYSSVSRKYKPDLIDALKTEIEIQADYTGGETIETIYLGGGTPSLLTVKEISSLLEKIAKYHPVSEQAEITLEANPDDLDGNYLNNLYKTPVNRLSIGIQSFNDKELVFMNRSHNAKQAIEAIKRGKDAGFENITIDLIYGIPFSTDQSWKYSLDFALKLDVQHISAYSMTYEPNTVFSKLVKNGEILPVDESQSIQQFDSLIQTTREAGFIQYEISNFGRAGFFSQHNSNYWKQKKYLGIGPVAHSYNLVSRQWNLRGIKNYIESIKKRLIPFEKEELSKNSRFNDYVMVSLRTIWGIDLSYIENNYGKDFLSGCIKNIDVYLTNEDVEINGKIITLTNKGKYISNRIISDLMVV